MDICFCFNNLGSFGLGATVTSLLNHCSDTSRIYFHFFCSCLDDEIKGVIINTLLDEFDGQYEFIDFNPDDDFKAYRSLQGDRTTYGRLLIPELIKAKQALYLDCDLLIETDVLQLDNINLDLNVIAAVGGTSFQYALENDFYIHTLNLKPETISFNAGVLIIDIERWKNENVKEKLLCIAEKYPNELLAADQTLLNAYFNGNFYNLSSHYNAHWYADSHPSLSTKSIYHFVGSPKPWDFLGRYLHTGYKKWKSYNLETWKKKILHRDKLKQFRRFLKIRRSYLKLLSKKVVI